MELSLAMRTLSQRFLQIPIQLKMLLGFGLMVGLVCASALTGWLGLNYIQGQLTKIVTESQPLLTEASNVRRQLQAAKGELAFYLLSQAEAHKQAYLQELAELQTTLSRLQRLPDDADDAAQRQVLATSIAEFAAWRDRLLPLADDVNKNFPALSVATREVSPLAADIAQQFNNMVYAEDQTADPKGQRRALLNLIHQARYGWAVVVNNVRGYLAYRQPSSLEQVRQFGAGVSQDVAQMSKQFSALLTLEQSEALDLLRDEVPSYFSKFEEMVKLHSGDAWRQDAYLMRTEVAPLLQRAETAVGELVARQQQVVGQAQQALLARVRLTTLLFASAVGVALFAAVLGYGLMRFSINQPLRHAVAVADRVAAGDIRGEIELLSQDEFGHLLRALQTMVANLAKLVRRVQESGIQLTSSSTEIAATSREQEATLSEQAASTNEIMATATEIAQTTAQLVATMNQVQQVARGTADTAASSQAELNRMEAALAQLTQATAVIANRLQVLNEKAANINSVVTTISKVADQTNLLSLNAAIEAEKAGEYGVGFAVVATEIRRLADQTAVATWDIEQMIKEIQQAVAASVNGVDQFTRDIQKGSEDLRRIAGSLGHMMHQVQTLSPTFTQVLGGMQNHLTSAEQINEAIRQLNDSAQQTVESIRYSNRAITQLNEAAQLLHEGVSQFRVA